MNSFRLRINRISGELGEQDGVPYREGCFCSGSYSCSLPAGPPCDCTVTCTLAVAASKWRESGYSGHHDMRESSLIEVTKSVVHKLIHSLNERKV